ncbi:hypothetical protein ACFQ1S_15025, partial [Kibdelosporangium lantanae]
MAAPVTTLTGHVIGGEENHGGHQRIDVVNPAKVLVVTTFNVDEYVYEALRAGASGFLLKDAPPVELVNGV